MPTNEQFGHIFINDFGQTENYTANPGRGSFIVKQQDRESHGLMIKNSLLEIQTQLHHIEEQTVPEGIVKDNVIYIDVLSEPDHKLKFESLEDGRAEKYRLLTTSELETNNGKVQKATVMLTENGIELFINKAEDYLVNEDRWNNPKNRKLFNNINQLLKADLRSFWNEVPSVQFPSQNEIVWWEIWLRKSNYSSNHNADIGKVIVQLEAVQINVSDKRIEFPEHIVILAKASPNQLAILMLLDNLAELRRPRETAEFFTSLSGVEQEGWIDDLKSRIENGVSEESIAICLLDSGVNNSHPLLEDFLPSENMDSIDPSWGTADGIPSGHGTQMAGLALYGDLSDLLASSNNIQILHQLESIKLINSSNPTVPELYGYNTEEAVSRATLLAPVRPRIFCMAITASEPGGGQQKGRPSSWSSSIDKIAFGENSQPHLIIISAGNIDPNREDEYPFRNYSSSIEDPCQAHNALVVGAYTEKDRITEIDGDLSSLAPRFALSPYSRTSMEWEKGWPIRPDIVMEGGNKGLQGNEVIRFDSLQLLTTNKQTFSRMLSPFWATSAAAALASRLAAQISIEYPSLWPETIRGLIVHSAEWTPEMLNNRKIEQLPLAEKKALLQTVGFGVPNLSKALYTVRNKLTLIAEKSIQPFHLVGAVVKTNQMHFFELPWPKEALLEMADIEVRLNITLSYFISPNPGNRTYASKFSYRSHGLKFNLNNPTETVLDFKKRINSEARSFDEDRPTGQTEAWMLNNLRAKGSVHRDIWVGTAADLSQKNLVAIYPQNGWFRLRKKLGKTDEEVRYSLIISIETEANNVDLYSPVMNIIDLPIDL